MKKIAIFISGRGSNMQAIVENCKDGVLKGIAQPVLVFSNKEDAEGLAWAKEQGIGYACIPSKGLKREAFDQEVLRLLKCFEPDCIVLAGYMRVLSEAFVKEYSGRIINIHPADTTKHQGLKAYEWAFEQKLDKTKITVHFVDEGLDTGAIIAQKEVDLQGVTSLADVEERGLVVEHTFYSETLAKVFSENNS